MRPPPTSDNPFDMGTDFQQFLDQQQQQNQGQPDPNQPNALDPPRDLGPGSGKHQKPNSESPTERNDVQNPGSGIGMGLNPDMLSPPSPESQGIGGPQAQPTPAQPKDPTPSNGQPFQPLQPPDPTAMVTPTQIGGGGGSLGSGSLLGGSGGLTGGGLNVPGQMGAGEEDNILPLLLQLIASKGQGGQNG